MTGLKDAAVKTEREELKDQIIEESAPKTAFWDKNKK
jgi:hypothetical protein